MRMAVIFTPLIVNGGSVGICSREAPTRLVAIARPRSSKSVTSWNSRNCRM